MLSDLSSAKSIRIKCIFKLCKITFISFIYKIKSKGPKMDPRGTPTLIILLLESSLYILVDNIQTSR